MVSALALSTPTKRITPAKMVQLRQPLPQRGRRLGATPFQNGGEWSSVDGKLSGRLDIVGDARDKVGPHLRRMLIDEEMIHR